MGGGVHDGIGALPDGIGLCPLATVPARARHGGIGSPPVRGHCQNFTKAHRAAGRPPAASGGWLGLPGRHGRRGARRNRGVALRNRALPARDRARKGRARLGHGGTGSPPLRGHCQNFTKAFRAAGRPPLASGGWLGLSGRHGRWGARWNRRVARRNRALPVRDRAQPWGHGGTGSPLVRAKPYSVVHPAAHGLQRGRATLRRPLAASRRLGEPS